MSARGAETRERLLDAAEALYGERGIDNVSLREIRLAAKQGNAAALQYHFGDRDGVLAALAARHVPRVNVIRDELMAAIDDDPDPSFRSLVEALVRPNADYLLHGPGARAWIKLMPELIAGPRLSMKTLRASASPTGVDVGIRIYTELTADIPPDVVGERVLSVAQFAIQQCANRAKVEDDPEAKRTPVSQEAFTQNLVDMAAGALTAAVDPRVLAESEGGPHANRQ